MPVRAVNLSGSYGTSIDIGTGGVVACAPQPSANCWEPCGFTVVQELGGPDTRHNFQYHSRERGTSDSYKNHNACCNYCHYQCEPRAVHGRSGWQSNNY